MHQFLNGQPLTPALPLQLRLIKKLADIPQAEVGQRVDVVGQVQGVGQLLLVEDADPAHAYAFGAGGEP